MGKINMGIFYGKKYNPRTRTFSLENGENFIEGTGLSALVKILELRVQIVIDCSIIMCDDSQ